MCSSVALKLVLTFSHLAYPRGSSRRDSELVDDSSDEIRRHEQHCSKSVSAVLDVSRCPGAASNGKSRPITPIEKDVTELMRKRKPTPKFPRVGPMLRIEKRRGTMLRSSERDGSDPGVI